MTALLNRKTRPVPRYCNCYHCIGEDRESGQNRRRERHGWEREYEHEFPVAPGLDEQTKLDLRRLSRDGAP